MLILAITLSFLMQDEPAYARRVLDRQIRKGDMTYDATYRRSLQIAQKTWAVEGTVRRLDDDTERFRIDGKVEIQGLGGARTETQAILWRKGDDWFFADRTQGTWCRGEGPGLGGEISAALYGLYDLAFSSRPERNAFDPAGWEDGGRSRFAGQVCASVTARTRDGSTQRWLIGGQDHLPVSIRSEKELEGAETLFVNWNRTSFKGRRLPETRVDPVDFASKGWKPVDPVASSVAEAFSGQWSAASSEVVSLAEGIDPFVERFNAASGQPRLLGLFGPT